MVGGANRMVTSCILGEGKKKSASEIIIKILMKMYGLRTVEWKFYAGCISFHRLS